MPLHAVRSSWLGAPPLLTGGATGAGQVSTGTPSL
jgi:hypothetical protein